MGLVAPIDSIRPEQAGGIGSRLGPLYFRKPSLEENLASVDAPAFCLLSREQHTRTFVLVLSVLMGQRTPIALHPAVNKAA